MGATRTSADAVNCGQLIRVKLPRLLAALCVRTHDIIRPAPEFFFGCIVLWGHVLNRDEAHACMPDRPLTPSLMWIP
jgi:hypothetical protein